MLSILKYDYDTLCNGRSKGCTNGTERLLKLPSLLAHLVCGGFHRPGSRALRFLLVGDECTEPPPYVHFRHPRPKQQRALK